MLFLWLCSRSPACTVGCLFGRITMTDDKPHIKFQYKYPSLNPTAWATRRGEGLRILKLLLLRISKLLLLLSHALSIAASLYCCCCCLSLLMLLLLLLQDVDKASAAAALWQEHAQENTRKFFSTDTGLQQATPDDLIRCWCDRSSSQTNHSSLTPLTIVVIWLLYQ